MNRLSHGELVQLAEEGRRKKMPRYIDAEKLTEALREKCDRCEDTRTDFCSTRWCDIAKVIKMIDNAPTVDAVEVVRCKDCEYCEEVDFGLWYCNSEDFKVVGSYTEADFYCGAGLRKHRKEKTDVE